VAIEEERIKEVRTVSLAEREKQAKVLAAQAEAEEQLLRTIKEAEAAEAAAKHRAVELTTIAQAELEAANREAEAKRVLAEGIRAEKAAPGLAEAQVREASAAAIEKVGIAEARVIEAKAEATYKQGSSEARVLAENLAAKAEGEAKLGQAQATSAEAVGTAEANVTLRKLTAEAEGLTKKFGAIDSLSETARAHEEFRMTLDTHLEQAIASINAGKEISRENAEVIAAALRNAQIDLVGGDGGMFESFTKALSLGRSIEGFAEKSPIVQDLMHRFLGVPRPEPRERVIEGEPADVVPITAAHDKADKAAPVA
jgi:hypothetical protein